MAMGNILDSETAIGGHQSDWTVARDAETVAMRVGTTIQHFEILLDSNRVGQQLYALQDTLVNPKRSSRITWKQVFGNSSKERNHREDGFGEGGYD
ncbi:hypothetical protein MA16_Dca006102 [Dendrobium catenatum]|uniref:Uncharacterized protein n=1 Tax=Dendrobium catenatum TaxID=906689 RepID=A0A2I0X4F8_9ASPA|nr:hypothetical protein MA16_Dca006102 [Dendrobium catenatum]